MNGSFWAIGAAPMAIRLIVPMVIAIGDHWRHLIKSVAKRKACLQPEKTHGYQYLFAVQFFDSYVYRSRINKGHLGGLDKVFKIRDRHHRIHRQILRLNEGLIFLLAQS